MTDEEIECALAKGLRYHLINVLTKNMKKNLVVTFETKLEDDFLEVKNIWVTHKKKGPCEPL